MLAAISRMKVNSPRISNAGSTAAAKGTKADRSGATKPRAISVLDTVAKYSAARPIISPLVCPRAP